MRRSKPILLVVTLLAAGCCLGSSEPLSAASLRLWLQADTIVGSDEDAVGVWTGSSAFSNNATQGTAGNQPTLQTNELNGHSVVRFDGADDFMNFGTSAAMTVFIVSKSDIANGGGRYYLGGTPFQNFQYQESAASNDLVYRIFDGTGNPSSNQATAASWSNWTIRQYTDTGTALTFFNNGASLGTVAHGAGLHFGQLGVLFNTAGPYDGDFAEVLIYDFEATTAQRQQAEMYLASKYGLQASLDPSNPYNTPEYAGASFNAETMTLVPVPELSAGTMFMVGGVIFGFGRRRSRR
jgi:hypothetical protein